MVLNRTVLVSSLFLTLVCLTSFIGGGLGALIFLVLAVFFLPKYGSIFLASTLIFQRLLVMNVGGNSIWFLVAFTYIFFLNQYKPIRVSKKYVLLLVFSSFIFLLNGQLIFLFAIVKIFTLKHFIDLIEIKEFTVSYFLGILFLVLYGYYSPEVYFLNHGGRLSIEPLTNPNIFAIDLLLLLLILSWKKSFPLVVLGFLTKSRTFVIGLTLVFLRRFKAKALFLVPIIFVSLLALFPDIFDRILNPRQGDISGDRVTIWAYYISYLLMNPEVFFLGGNILEIVSRSPIQQVPHNLILEGIINYGLIGFFTLFVHLKTLGVLSFRDFIAILWLPIAFYMPSHDLFNLSFITLYFVYVKQFKEVSLVSER
jgi:hypothetical protein